MTKILRTDAQGNKAISNALKSDTLSEGDKKNAVKWLERMLQNVGYGGKPDAAFGPRTTEALKVFQKAVGLPETGELNRATFNALASAQRRVHTNKAPFAGLGQKGVGIKGLEQKLRTLGYDSGNVDGVFDQQTANAVKAFRADQKELQDGLASLNNKAIASLNREAGALAHTPYHGRVTQHVGAHKQLDQDTAAAATALNHNPDLDGIGPATKNKKVVANVQAHLGAAGFAPKRADGVWDERTEAALRAFQHRSGLPVTGRVDSGTWDKLKAAYTYAKGKADPAQQLGEKSSAVLDSEKLLKKMGVNPGKVDGIYDQQTVAAVKKWEKKHHLTADGKIGRGELAQMVTAAKKSANPGLQAVKYALQFVGYKESDNNGNKFSAYFNRNHEAWCCDFVSYCFEKTGNPIGKKGVGYAYVPSLRDHLKATGKWHSTPKPGAICIFGSDAHHVGMVVAVKNGMVYTVEGNDINDRVGRHSYAINAGNISGYGY